MSIFVFGSNLAGRHGAGAALYARRYRGAVYGKGEGRQGDSYAIPTKDEELCTLPLTIIQQHVKRFIAYSSSNPNETFFVTRIGCGLVGYSESQIAPMFKDAPTNCELPSEWRPPRNSGPPK